MNFTGLVTVFVLLLPIVPTENQLALVSDNLYFDKTEVSNAQWQRFEAELINKGKDLELYRKLSNPLNNWTQFINFNFIKLCEYVKTSKTLDQS